MSRERGRGEGGCKCNRRGRRDVSVIGGGRGDVSVIGGGEGDVSVIGGGRGM